MQAIRVSRYGGPDVLVVETVPISVPQHNQVLIEVKAVGVNPVEDYIRSGAWEAKVVAAGGAPFMQFPYTPGSDAAGIVKAVGADVNNFKVGDRVFTCAIAEAGAYAQYMAANAARVFPLPEHLTFSQGATLGVPYFTAVKALSLKAQAKKGESILVHGASGGVGIATVQLASGLGMDVVGTASTEEGSLLVKANGARVVLNHKDKDHKKNLMEATGGVGFNVIVEVLANVNLPLDLEVAKIGGRVVLVGSRGKVDFDPWLIISKEAAVFGDALWLSSEDEWKTMAKELTKALESTKFINPAIEKELPLSQAAQAHKEVIEHTSGTKGKLILIP